jgi:hypothetical protein
MSRRCTRLGVKSVGDQILPQKSFVYAQFQSIVLSVIRRGHHAIMGSNSLLVLLGFRAEIEPGELSDESLATVVRLSYIPDPSFIIELKTMLVVASYSRSARYDD